MDKLPINYSPEEIESEFKSIHRQFVIGLIGAFGLIIGGAFIYRHLMHLTWVNAVYFTTITLTTIGYGDIHPDNNASKIFTIFFVFVGIATIGAFVNLLIRHAVMRREVRRIRRNNSKKS